MHDRFRILDADRHVIEPYGLWNEYLERDFKHEAPRPVRFFDATGAVANDPDLAALAERRPMLVVGGRPVCRNMSVEAWVAILRASVHKKFAGPLDRPGTHLAHMDEEGIEAAVLYPTYGLLIEGVDTLSPELGAALARAYNRWLADFCAAAPDRLFGAALVSVHAPGHMRAEVEWAERARFRAVVVRPNPVAGRRLSDAAYEPFWADCEARSLAVVVHEGTHAHLPSAGADRFSTRFGQHACSHPFEQMIAMLDLVEGGVFERHPRLRVAFVEAGCGWLPYWMWRLDSEYANLREEVAGRVRQPPSHYFRRSAWVTGEPDEPNLAEVLGGVGQGRVVFGTDFPHVDHEDDLVARARARAESEAGGPWRDYFWNSAARLFGFSSST